MEGKCADASKSLRSKSKAVQENMPVSTSMVGHLNWLPTIRLFDIRTKELAFQEHSGIWSEPEKPGVGYLGTATRLPT